MTKPISDPYILALETSGALLSVSVRHAGKIASLVSDEMTYGHAKDIVPTALHALKMAGCRAEMVTHVAAGAGPGSFTGIRVALACAKGFCLAWGAKGVGVSGLQAVASCAAELGHNDNAPMLITADTRRGSLYGQFFAAGGQASGAIFEASPAELPALRTRLLNAQQAQMPLYIGGFDDPQIASIFATEGTSLITPATAMPLDAAMIAVDAERQIISGMITPLVPLYLAAAKLGPAKKSSPKNQHKSIPAAQG